MFEITRVYCIVLNVGTINECSCLGNVLSYTPNRETSVSLFSHLACLAASTCARVSLYLCDSEMYSVLLEAAVWCNV